MDKLIVAGDVATRYSDEGTGDNVIVLLHGYLESIEIWEDFIPLLSSRYRVLAMDIPGHGISEVVGESHSMEFLADVVHDWLQELKVNRCVLVGHSMGGYVAAAFLEKYPDMLSGLVLLHSTPKSDTEEKRRDRMREMALVRSGKKELLSRVSPSKAFALENRKNKGEWIENMGFQVMLTEDDGIVALLNGMAERTDRSLLMRNSSVPQLYIFGKKDEYIPQEVAQIIKEEQPQARVEWLEHSGHMGFIEEPLRCASLISEFSDLCFKKSVTTINPE